MLIGHLFRNVSRSTGGAVRNMVRGGPSTMLTVLGAGVIIEEAYLTADTLCKHSLTDALPALAITTTMAGMMAGGCLVGAYMLGALKNE
jgi:hypothetical protein